MSEVRGSGWEELPRVQGKGQRQRGAIPCPRSSGCTRAGCLEELLHVQGQEGWW